MAKPIKAVSVAFAVLACCSSEYSASGASVSVRVRGALPSSAARSVQHREAKSAPLDHVGEPNFAALNQYVADVWEPYNSNDSSPIIWNPLSSLRGDSSSTLEKYLSECIGLELTDTQGPISSISAVDVDVIVSSDLHYTASSVLTSEHQGRIFTMMQHPVHRMMNLDQQEEQATDTDQTPSHLVDNIMTRQLVGKTSALEEVSAEDLEDAKAVLSHKVLVGLTEKQYYTESIKRFSTYFAWEDPESCTTLSELEQEQNRHHSHGASAKFSLEWEVFEDANKWDLELYDYAIQLFEKQAFLFPKKDDADSSIFSQMM